MHTTRNLIGASVLAAALLLTSCSMSATSRPWTAASGGVGPSPALAPLARGMAGICLALSTVGWSRESDRGSAES